MKIHTSTLVFATFATISFASPFHDPRDSDTVESFATPCKRSEHGKTMCHGHTHFGQCNWGTVVWRPMALGTICSCEHRPDGACGPWWAEGKGQASAPAISTTKSGDIPSATSAVATSGATSGRHSAQGSKYSTTSIGGTSIAGSGTHLPTIENGSGEASLPPTGTAKASTLPTGGGSTELPKPSGGASGEPSTTLITSGTTATQISTAGGASGVTASTVPPSGTKTESTEISALPSGDASATETSKALKN